MRDKTRDKIMAAPEKTERRESRKTEGKPARASSKEGEGTKAEAPGFCRKGGSRLKPEEKKRLPLLSVPRPEMRRERPSRSLKRVCN